MKKILTVVGIGFAVIVLAILIYPTQNRSQKSLEKKPAVPPKPVITQTAQVEPIRELAVSVKKVEPPPSAPSQMPLKPGEDLSYYVSGAISAQWTFGADLKSGVLRTYYKTGELWMEIQFREGRLNGTWRSFYPTGKLWTQVLYEKGVRSSAWKVFYEDGEVWAELHEEEGVVKTPPCLYSFGGKPALGTQFDQLSGSGYFKAYDAEGRPMSDWGFSKDGANSVKTFYQDGRMSSEWYLKNGIPHGEVRFYYPDGTLMAQQIFQDGRHSGDGALHYINGQLWVETKYDATGLEDSAAFYYPGGALWFKIVFQPKGEASYPKLVSEIKVSAEAVEESPSPAVRS
ncbi:MAG: hypothetical protein ACOY3K_04915 [Candidatus Omnitrophota bacterium]